MAVPEDDSSPAERERAAAQKQRQATLTDVLAKAAEHYRRQLQGSPRAIDYLKRRGLTGEIAARFGLGYAPEGWRSLASAFPRYDDPLLEESGLVIAQDVRRRQRGRHASATTASATASCSRSARSRARSSASAAACSTRANPST